MPDAVGKNVPLQDTPASSPSLVLRPRWPSPVQVAFGALGNEEPFTPALSQYLSKDAYLPSRAAHLFPRPVGQQVNAFKVLPTEFSTPTPNTMDAAHSTHHPTNRKVDAFSAPSTEPSTPDMIDMETRMESLLEPVTFLLERLQGTTLPPYNSRVQTKSAAQVLSDRLLPVGQHVLNLLKREWEVEVSEVDIWQWSLILLTG
jgi:hypothetical protein